MNSATALGPQWRRTIRVCLFVIACETARVYCRMKDIEGTAMLALEVGVMYARITFCVLAMARSAMRTVPVERLRDDILNRLFKGLLWTSLAVSCASVAGALVGLAWTTVPASVGLIVGMHATAFGWRRDAVAPGPA